MASSGNLNEIVMLHLCNTLLYSLVCSQALLICEYQYVKNKSGLGINGAKVVNFGLNIWSFNVQTWRTGTHPEGT